MGMAPDASDQSPEKIWNTPVIEDFCVATTTEHRFTGGIDNYEADNPVNYGS